MASEERTFVAIKPDGVKRGLIGRIIQRFEDKGFKNAKGTMIVREIDSESDLNNKIQTNDMIVAINGKTLTDTDVLTSVLSKSSPGDTVKLTVARINNNKIETFEVKCKLIETKKQ